MLKGCVVGVEEKISRVRFPCQESSHKQDRRTGSSLLRLPRQVRHLAARAGCVLLFPPLPGAVLAAMLVTSSRDDQTLLSFFDLSFSLRSFLVFDIYFVRFFLPLFFRLRFKRWVA